MRSLCPVNVGKGSETVLLEGMKAAGEAIKSEIVVNLNNAHLTLEIFTKNAPLLNDAATSQKRLNPVNSMGLSVPQQNRPKSFQYTAPVCIGHRSSQDISENMPSAPLVRENENLFPNRSRVQKNLNDLFLVLACDGSGSLGRRRMHRLKQLVKGILQGNKADMRQTIAGFYHSGFVSAEGGRRPLLQWIWHPHRMAGFECSDAIERIAAFPHGGEGVQSDALSLWFILNEAICLAEGKMIHLIWITDGEWNRSFYVGKDAEEEIQICFESISARLAGFFRVTLVSLKHTGDMLLSEW